MLRRVMDRPAAPGAPLASVVLAWGVHLLTACGGVAGLVALLAAGRGDLRTAALLMLVALAIDAVDGSLARAARVAERLPSIDGRRLDDIVDYLNYVVVPAVFLVEAGSLLHWGFAAAPVLASAYGFAQSDAKSDDHFFVGFPSYWNVLALYAWALPIGAGATTALVIALSIAVFVPLKYLYPSRMNALWWTTNATGAAWLLLLAILIGAPGALGAFPWLEVSLVYPLYYLGVSFWLGGMHRRTS